MIRAAASTSDVRQHVLLPDMSIVKRTLLSALLVGTLACAIVAQRAANHADRFNPSGEYHPLNRTTDYLDLQFHLQVRYKRGSLVAWGDVYGSGESFL